MATSTSIESVGPNWSLVHTGAGSVLIQLLEPDSETEVYLGDGNTTPANTTTRQGVVLWDQNPFIAIGGLQAADEVYVRNLLGGEGAPEVAVMASGS